MAAKVKICPLCPFYGAKVGIGVQCTEGIKGADIKLRFKDVKDYQEHYRERCCGRYALCPIYRLILTERYEEAYQEYLKEFQK